MSHKLLALTDIRPNLAAATVVLIAGAGVVVTLYRREDGNGDRSRLWIPFASLVAGPVLAFGFWAAEVFLFNPGTYPTAFQGDAMATLLRVMVIGTFVGVVVSVVLAIVMIVRRRT